jgi:hypothetical protein
MGNALFNTTAPKIRKRELQIEAIRQIVIIARNIF